MTDQTTTRPAPARLTVAGVSLPVITREVYARALRAERARHRDTLTEPVTVGGVTPMVHVETEPSPVGYVVERHQKVVRYFVGSSNRAETWLGYGLRGDPWWTARVSGQPETGTRSTTSAEAALKGCRRKLGRVDA